MSSKLGAFLQKHQERLNMKQRDLAESLGVFQSHLSKIMQGKRKALDVTTITRMIDNFRGTRAEKGELLKNYLLDQCPAPHEKLVVIEVAGEETSRIHETPAPYGAAFPKDHIDALEDILRDDHASPKLTRVLGELFESAATCPELARVLEDMTKLEISAKKPTRKLRES